jgi:hypothetical protein
MQVAKYAEIEWTRTVGSRGGGSKRYDELPADKRPGNRFKRLFKGVPGEPGNFEVSVTKTIRSEEVKHYPRHHHIFEQLRMTLVGTPEWTPRSPTPPGWVIYVGAGTFYGPYDRQEGHEQLHIQFEGANCPPFPGYEALMSARDALAAKGSFEKGFFVWTDDDGKVHRQDGHEANLQHAIGRKVVYPEPRYTTPVNMNPENFSWLRLADGVREKELARFTEGETRVAMLRIASGTAYTFTGLDQRTLLFLYQGSGTAGGVQLVERDGVLLDPGESVDLAADADLAFLIVGLPRVAEVAAAAETVTAQVPGSRVASNA